MKDRQDPLEKKIAAALARMGIRGAGVVCAVSGGLDSVALLHCLARLRGEFALRLWACHFEHGIRGEDSLGDQIFVQELCARLDVPLYTERADIPAVAGRRGQGLELAAREERHAFYRRALAHFSADFCALAHHADDQAETVLMHILRGARAALGMREAQGHILRPFLSIPKADIHAYALRQDIAHREDATNQVADNPRNALRLEVFPKLREIYPGAVSALGRLADYAAQEEDDLSAMAQDWLAKAKDGDGLRLEELPLPSVLRRALCAYATEQGAGELTSADVERLCALPTARVGARVVLRGAALERTAQGILPVGEQTRWEPVQIDLAQGGCWRFGPWRVRAERAERPLAFGARDSHAQYFDADIAPRLTARTRQQGDRMHPFGAQGGKALKKLLIDLKIPRARRESLPLLALDEEIYWAVGAARSAHAPVSDKTERIARVVFDRINEKEGIGK